MSEKVVWQLLQPYAEAAGLAGIAPHDLRRSCAKMCRAAGGELEQIQLLLVVEVLRQQDKPDDDELFQQFQPPSRIAFGAPVAKGLAR